MPEVAEVKLSSEFVSKHGNRIFVKIEKSSVSKIKTDLSLLNFSKFTIKSRSRGKEMEILFIDASVPFYDASYKRMKITLGMSGAWIYYDPKNKENEKFNKHTHLRITDEKGWILGLYDVRRFAKWSWGNFDLVKRSPCPLYQPSQFQDNLKQNWHIHKDFKKYNLSEILMNQYWFNGIGNYLRAEILYRLNKNPFMKASELTLPELYDLLDLTIECVNQSYKLGGGQLKDWKNPNGEDPASFNEWIKCYRKKESIIDRSGRTFWYDNKWKIQNEQ